MIKSGLKNYFVNLKYYFTPIGTLAIAMVLGLSIFLPIAFSALTSMADKIIDIISSTEVSFSPIKDYLVDAVRSMNWSDPIEALKIMFTRDWLNGVISECFNLLSAELQPYSQQITEAVDTAIGAVKACFAGFITFSLAGIILGYFLTKFLVRRNIAKRNVRKFLIAAVIDFVLIAAIHVLCIWLYLLWKPSIIITSLLSLFLFAFKTLFEAYLVHGFKKVEIKTVLNVKTALKLLLTDSIIFYISIIFLIITIIITNVLAGLFAGFAFVEIAFIVINLNAESYVLSLLPKGGIPEPQSAPQAA